jgi:hypothetical protein
MERDYFQLGQTDGQAAAEHDVASGQEEQRGDRIRSRAHDAAHTFREIRTLAEQRACQDGWETGYRRGSRVPVAAA